MDFPERPLVFVWWNTSLSPLGTRRGTDEDESLVLRYIKAFREEQQADVIGLGEVNAGDLEAIVNGLNDPHLAVHDASGVVDGTRFDIALLYDVRRLNLMFSRPQIASYGTHTLKIGEHVDFNFLGTDTPITVVVSHWPSRMFAPDFAAKRSEMGMALRGTLDSLRFAAHWRRHTWFSWGITTTTRFPHRWRTICWQRATEALPGGQVRFSTIHRGDGWGNRYRTVSRQKRSGFVALTIIEVERRRVGIRLIKSCFRLRF